MPSHQDCTPLQTEPAAAGAMPRSHFDFIVCGAGSAGSVVAGRLAENPELRVLLIEAGGNDEFPDVLEPGRWPLNLGTERDWNFSAAPNPHVNHRQIPLNLGRVLGGGRTRDKLFGHLAG